MHPLREKEHFPRAVIPAVAGRQHILVLPYIGGTSESSQINVRFVFERNGLDENRIGEHVHIISKDKRIYLRVIRAAHALYNLSVLVPHCASALKNSHGIRCVIVKMASPQRIVVLVRQFHHRTAELRKIVIYQISELVACQHRLILENADISPGINDFRIHIPQGSVTKKESAVMKKACRTDNFPVAHPVNVKHLRGLGAQQHDKAVLRTFTSVTTTRLPP